MEPTFHTGDLIISRKAEQYKIGDVVTYKIPDEKYKKFRIVHRVIGRTKDGGYEIQGDNQDHADPWSIPAANIVGTKVFMIPKGGVALGYVRNPIGLALLFGALVTWTFWPKKNQEEAEGNPLLAPCDLAALLCPDSRDTEELLVVGTSLTYAQFLNRPSLRDVVHAQAASEQPKMSLEGSSDIVPVMTSEVPLKSVPDVRSVVTPTHSPEHGVTEEVPEGVPPVVPKTVPIRGIEPLSAPSFSCEAHQERHLADWTTRVTKAPAAPTDAMFVITKDNTVIVENSSENESGSNSVDHGPIPNFAESWGFEEDTSTTEVTTGTSPELDLEISPEITLERNSEATTRVPETTPEESSVQPTIDELLERWINDDADAPLPEELFVTPYQ